MRRNVFLLGVLLAAAPLAADDSTVYESLSGVQIGRVFLSQQQRVELDARREQVADGDVGKRTARATPSQALPSAGYIIGRNGYPKVWKDGDFVTTRDAETTAMKFPGDVPVTRHEPEAVDD
jgi:hypothetical protein